MQNIIYLIWYVHRIIFEISNLQRIFVYGNKSRSDRRLKYNFFNTDSTYSTEYRMVYKLILTCLLHLPHISDEWGT